MSGKTEFQLFIVLRRYFIIQILFILPCFSCHKDVIDINLNETGQQIVIEGAITDLPGPYTVRISKTTDFFEPGVCPPVSDAVVTISDDEGNSETLKETSPGNYQTSSIRGVPGRTYTLSVAVDDEHYTAISTMPLPLELDSLKCLKETDNIYDRTYFLSCYLSDHKGIEEYCRFKIYKNGELLNWEYYLYSDKSRDGQYFTIDDFNFSFTLYDIVRVELLAIDEATYQYFSMLNSILDKVDEDAEDVGQILMPVTLFNPTSNLSNNALGYFSAHTVRIYVFVVL